jgi:hypothetical protein
MRAKLISSLPVFICLTLLASAQEAPQAPAPPAALGRLHYFVGNWDYEFNMHPSSYGPGGKMTGRDHNEMMPGGFFLLSHSKGVGTLGEFNALAVFGYDPDERVYTYNAFNNWGEREFFKGTVDGAKWTWLSESKMIGKVVKTRFSAIETSKDSYSMKFEIMNNEDGSWKEVMDGKAEKVK